MLIQCIFSNNGLKLNIPTWLIFGYNLDELPPKNGIQFEKKSAFSFAVDLKIDVNEKYKHIRTFQLAKKK